MVVKNVGGWACAWASAKFGAWTGGILAGVGGQAGPQVVTPEELVTVPLGAAIGGVVGGVGGYFAGTEIAETVYDWAFQQGMPVNELK